MDLSEQLRYARRKLRITQAQLARATGISAVTIARWESVPDLKPQMALYGRFLDYCESNGIVFEEKKMKGTRHDY